MVKTWLPALLAVVMAGCGAGCVYVEGMWRSEVMDERAVSIAEALQLPKDTPVYTAFNLWYDREGELSARNYQTENYLPVGTEIVPVDASLRRIVFDADGRRWELSFNAGRMMMPVEDYIRLLFTTTPWEERVAGMEPEYVEAIRDGAVVRGMNRDQVRMAFGPPGRSRTPDDLNATWLYELGPTKTIRVIFRGNRVSQVVDFFEL